MAISEVNMELLKRQGLAADIRNKLSPAKQLFKMIQALEKITDEDKRKRLLSLIKKDAEVMNKSVENICDALDAFRDQKNKIPF